ncbi:hypothetical protein CK203_081536 [Vitis vinifera]|uniref:Uncharacterized protein n=1 Tax=Vitis vinifera TaxID=29760 RepID=A0A438DYQ0_VITVI|nr:hypothetical protein CK203_081536 [Vitis vinifera]
MATKKTTSSSRASEVRGKAIDKLDAKEFRERFCIPDNVAVELLNGRVLVPFEKAEERTMIFSKEQFNAGLRFPLPPLFKEFLHFTQIPPVFIHPNIHVCTPALPPTGDGAARFDKGRGDGTRGGPGCMGGAFGASGEAFLSKLLLGSSGRQGEAVQYAADARNLAAVVRESREYVINILPRKMPKEVVPGEHYTVKDFPIYEALKEADSKKRRLLLEGREKKKNEGTLRKAPGQKGDVDSSPKKDPVKRRKLVKKHGKDTKEPTPPLEFAPPPIIHEAEVMIEEPVNAAPHSISSGSGHLAGLNHSSTSLTAVARLANMAEEVASVNHPDSRNLDADAAEAVCATPTEEVGVENQSQPSDDPDRLALVLVTGPPSKKARSVRNLRSGLHGRLQEQQQEIEVSCSSAHDTHPEGGEVEMVTEISAVPVVVSDEFARGVSHPAVDADAAPGNVHPAVDVEVPNPEQECSSLASSGGDPVNDASCTSASPFSYAELEEKLKQIPPGLPLAKPSAQMFEMVETLVSGLRGMATQYDLFTDLLRTTDYMKAFATRRKDAEDQLRLRLAEAEASLSTARGRMRLSGQTWLMQRSGRNQWIPLLEAANEMADLRGEVRQLRTEVSIEKKQREDLQLRLIA